LARKALMDRRIPIWLFAICLVLCLGAGWAQNWDSVRRAGAEVKTISATFVQTKKLKILKEPLVSKGRFVFKAPDSLLWEYSSPVRSLTLMQAGKLQRYVWSDNQWRGDANPSSQAVQAVLGKMKMWLQGNFQDQTGFTATLESGPPAVIKLEAGKAMRPYVEEIILRLGRSPGAIKSIDIKEYGNSSTRIEFNDLKLNAPVGEEVFAKP
jgi:hypothetical protein